MWGQMTEHLVGRMNPRAGRRRLASVAVLLMVGILLGAILSGCADALNRTVGTDPDRLVGVPVPEPVMPGTVTDGGTDTSKGGEYPVAEAPGVSVVEGWVAAAPLEDGAKIVKTGTLTLEVEDVAKSLTAAKREIDRLGGYVGASEEQTTEDRTYATITYRIPADRWDEAIAALRALATTVVGEQTQALEVTGQLVDLEARIKNLRASEAALQEILAKASKVSDILEVESRLSDVRGQIEALEAQRVTLENQVAYGTLTVGFSAPIVAVTEVQEGWDPLGEVDRAVAAMLNVLQAVATGAIWFAIVILPMALVVLAVLGLALFAGRRLFGRRRPSSPSSPGAGPTSPDEAPSAA